MGWEEEMEGYEPPPGDDLSDLEGYEPPPQAAPEPPSAWQRFAAAGKVLSGMGGAAPKMMGIGAAMAPAPGRRAAGRGMAPVVSPEAQEALAYTEAQETAQRELEEARETPFAPEEAITAMKALPGVGLGARAMDAVGVDPLPRTAGAAAERAAMAASVPLAAGGLAATALGRLGQSALYAGGPAAGMAAAQTEAETPGEYATEVGTAGAVATGAGHLVSEAPRMYAGAKRMIGQAAEGMRRRGSERLATQFGDPQLAAQAEELADPTSVAGQARRAQALRGQDPEVLEAHQQRVVDDMNMSLEARDRITAEASIADKGAAVAEAMAREGVEWQPGAGDDIVSAIAEDVLTTRGGPRRGADLSALSVAPEDNALLNKVDDALTAYKNQRESITDPRDHFLALDDLKRRIQRVTETAYRTGRRHIGEQIEYQHAEPLRQMLQDKKKWGAEAADIQTRENAAWVADLRGVKEAARRITREGAEESARSGHRGLQEARTANVYSAVEHAGDPRYAQETADLQRMMDTSAELGEALSMRRPVADDPLRALAARQRGAAERVRATMVTRGGEREAAEEMKRIRELTGQAQPGLVTRGLERVGVPVRELQGDVAARAGELAKREAAAAQGVPLAQRELDAMRAFAERAQRVRGMAGAQATQGAQRAAGAMRPLTAAEIEELLQETR